MKLSNYTHAHYCSDNADLMAGIDEIKEAVRQRLKADRIIPCYYYSRLEKLERKLAKLSEKGIKQFNTNNIMNYRCREIQEIIEQYEKSVIAVTGNGKILIDQLKAHITKYGGIYEIAGISKIDFEVNGFDTTNLDNDIIDKIAGKIDIGDSIAYGIEYWADRYGIPKLKTVGSINNL